MSDPLILQMPSDGAQQLLLLFHGMGNTSDSMAPIGRRLATEFPQAAIVCIQAPHPSDVGRGYQWFSATDVTEASRPARIAAAMPDFRAVVEDWQAKTGATAAMTALIGFSQGAIMSLESTQSGEPLAGRIVALSGRFATLPAVAPATVTFHLIHGEKDTVIAHTYAISQAEHLLDRGADVTADIFTELGHTVSQQALELVVERLKTHVPQHVWQAAQAAAASEN